MLNFMAKSYEYTNGNCFVDGVLQPTTEQCTNVTNAFFNIGIALLVLFIFFAVITLTLFVFWVIQLIHVIKHEDIKDRTMWIVLLVASFIVGFMWLIVPVYYFAVMRNYNKNKTVQPNVQAPEVVASPPENTTNTPT
jgi:type VI protein secretion system component VasK